MEDMDIAVKSQTNVDIHIVARQWCIQVKLIKKEMANKFGIERAVDMGG
jgi:hypothetical protein